jgi:hypothetical protein
MEAKPKPRIAKAHSSFVAGIYLRLGWTLVHEFFVEGDDEPYEYLLKWDRPEEPPDIDWGALSTTNDKKELLDGCLRV